MKPMKIAHGEKVVISTKSRNDKKLGKFANKWFDHIVITDDWEAVKVLKRKN